MIKQERSQKLMIASGCFHNTTVRVIYCFQERVEAFGVIAKLRKTIFIRIDIKGVFRDINTYIIIIFIHNFKFVKERVLPEYNILETGFNAY